MARSAAVTGPRFVQVTVRGQDVLLSRLRDGRAVAFGRVCPHENLPMDEGVLWAGEVDCPHHHYTYDPRTGRNCYPRRVFPAFKAADLEGLPTWEVREARGWIFIGERRDPPVG